jgi:hypothetical protein
MKDDGFSSAVIKSIGEKIICFQQSLLMEESEDDEKKVDD